MTETNDELGDRLDNLEDKVGDQSVEASSFSTEDTGIDSNTKIDQLIATAAEVKAALNRRSIIIAFAIAIPVTLALTIGAFLLWRINEGTQANQEIAENAYRQAITNNRDVLQYRRDFAQTRDCPVVYLKDLLRVSSERGDLNSVQPPCLPEDIAEIDRKISEVEARIAEVGE